MDVGRQLRISGCVLASRCNGQGRGRGEVVRPICKWTICVGKSCMPSKMCVAYTMVALRISLSLRRKSSRSQRTCTSRSTVTSSSRSKSQGAISPIQSWTRRLSPSLIMCIFQDKSTSRRSSSISRRSLKRKPPTESRKSLTVISPRTTGFIAHSVPRNVIPHGGE